MSSRVIEFSALAIICKLHYFGFFCVITIYYQDTTDSTTRINEGVRDKQWIAPWKIKKARTGRKDLFHYRPWVLLCFKTKTNPHDVLRLMLMRLQLPCHCHHLAFFLFNLDGTFLLSCVLPAPATEVLHYLLRVEAGNVILSL